MRAGLASSTLVHVALLSWGLLSFSAPDAFEVEDVQALPVELVSIAELTQIQEGSEEAPKDGPAAVDPVVTPEPRPEAENIGDNERDQATPETETQQAVEVEEARLPEPVDIPIPQPVVRPEPAPEPVVQPEETPSTPATELAPVPEPREEVTPDPVEELIASADPEPAPEAEVVELPQNLPRPTARPQNAPAQTARTPERRVEDAPTQTAAANQTNTERDTSEEISSLINRETGSGGGAANSTEQASRGGERTTGGTTLTQSEMDSLRGQIQACWSVPVGILASDNLKVSVRFALDRGGKLEGVPRITSSSGVQAMDDSAVRAIRRCNLQNNGFQLPADKFDAWRDVVVNFDPSEMF